MQDPFSHTSLGRVTPLRRRQFLRNGALALTALSGGVALPGRRFRAQAATPDNVVRVLGVSTGALADWSNFEKATGLKMEWTPASDDVGLFLHDMIAGDAGERYDLVTCLSGSYAPLADQDLLMPIDLSRLNHWTSLPGFVSGVTPKAPGANRAWGVPYHMNADSFLYAPKRLGLPDAPAEISWKLIYDDPRTRGKVAIDNEIYALICASIYVKAHKLAEIGDLANMTASECHSVAEFLIERKRAGQFRTTYKSFDEQLQLLVGGEVIAETGWEPVAHEAQRRHDDVAYAYTVEGYDKWAQNLMVPAQVASRNGSDKVYATIDWMLGGAYAAELSTREGYMTPRLDLGLTYAQEQGWSAERIALIWQVIHKGTAKLSKPLFWDPGYFTNFASYQTEMARFRNA